VLLFESGDNGITGLLSAPSVDRFSLLHLILFSLRLFFYLYFFTRTHVQTIKRFLYLQQIERSVREKKKETRKGGLERFFSLQAALPRLFLGRILPNGVTQAAEGDIKFNPDYWFGRWVGFRKFSSPTRKFSGSCEPHEVT
jgi:hypothetical protein